MPHSSPSPDAPRQPTSLMPSIPLDVVSGAMFATLAHEIRNPLAPLQNALEVLRAAPENPALVARCHSIIDRQITDLANVADTVLDLNALFAGQTQVNFESVSLAAVLQRAVTAFTQMVGREPSAMAVELPPNDATVLVDVPRVSEVFRLLLDRVRLSAPSGAHVVVSWAMRGREVEVFVGATDATGAQTADERHDGLNTAEGYLRGGTRIVLAVVRELIASHGGAIEIQQRATFAEPGFAVRLPVATLGGPGTEQTS